MFFKTLKHHIRLIYLLQNQLFQTSEKKGLSILQIGSPVLGLSL